jgi:uncharacterized membrane protein YkvA (DUF1232 family)
MKAPTLDEYIKDHAARLVPADRGRIRARASQLHERAGQADATRHPRLRAQAAVLAELFSNEASTGKLSRAEAEAAVGALYLLKGFDIIPDEVVPIGFDDDALLLDRIFERNRAALAGWAGDRFSEETLREALP